MKKIILILIFIIVLLLLDNIQALLFNNSPIIKIRTYLDNNSYVDKGLFVNTYYCYNSDSASNIKGTKYECVKEREIDNMKVVINNKEYDVILEDNDIIKLLPLKVSMNELNGNEYYYYLDKSIRSNSNNYDIKKGDIMLYQDNCIVIFYKNVKTSYNYTKIGHINNLLDYEDDKIEVLFK